MDISPIALLLSLLLGIGVAAIGIFAIVNPKKAAAHYGVKTKDDGLTWVMAAGVRDVFIGLVFILLYFQNDSALTAKTCLCVAIVAIADGILVLKSGVKKASYVHFAAAIFAISLASVLILIS